MFVGIGAAEKNVLVCANILGGCTVAEIERAFPKMFRFAIPRAMRTAARKGLINLETEPVLRALPIGTLHAPKPFRAAPFRAPMRSPAAPQVPRPAISAPKSPRPAVAQPSLAAPSPPMSHGSVESDSAAYLKRAALAGAKSEKAIEIARRVFGGGPPEVQPSAEENQARAREQKRELA